MSKTLLQFFAFAVLIAGIAWNSSAILRERCLIALLVSEFAPVQELAAKELHNYPSKTTALALVTFVNFQAPTKTKILNLSKSIQNLENNLEDETIDAQKRSTLEKKIKQLRNELEQEKVVFEKEFPKKKKLANSGLRSLSYLSGESFGTRNKERASYNMWTMVGRGEWSRATAEVNAWAFRTFSKDLLEAL